MGPNMVDQGIERVRITAMQDLVAVYEDRGDFLVHNDIDYEPEEDEDAGELNIDELFGGTEENA